MLRIVTILSVAIAGGASLVATPLAAAEPPTLKGTLVVVSPKSSQAALIDIASKHIRKTLETGKGPHEVAASPDGKLAAVCDYAGTPENPGSTLTIIDIPAAAVAKTINLAPHRKPHGIAWLDNERVICTSQESKALVIVNIAKGEVERVLETGTALTHMLSLSADKKLVASASITEGNVSVFELPSGNKLAEIPAEIGSEGIAMSPDGRCIWTGNTKAQSVSVIDVARKERVKTLPLAGYPIRAAFALDGSHVFISLPEDGAIAVFDPREMKVVNRIKVRGGPIEFSGQSDPVTIAMQPDGRYGFAAIYSGSDVAVLDLKEMTVVDKLPALNAPDGLAYSPLEIARQ